MPRDCRIVPAILTDSPQELETMIRQSETFTDFVQIDIMDGQFVPSKSVAAGDLQKLEIQLKWEAHLMVMQPENYLEDYMKAGAGKIVFHYEAATSPRDIITRIRKLGLSAGMAVNPETPVSSVLPLADELDSVLLLSVHPGFYGAKFIPEVLDKITECRRRCPKMQIDIDGGIKESNVAAIASRGVDAICVGSAIFLQPQPGESYRRLTEIARGNQSTD